jgi:hypothetical protein
MHYKQVLLFVSIMTINGIRLLLQCHVPFTTHWKPGLGMPRQILP